MDIPDYQRAKRHAFQRLEKELPPGLYYHNSMHTALDVVPATEKFAAGEGIVGEPLLLLLTAAWFHDLGYIEVRVGHETVSARMASEALPGFGFTKAQIQLINRIILVTVVPQSPVTILEQIMADADLDVLGREDFLERNGSLRRELAFFGEELVDSEWYSAQLEFLEAHTYFTGAARAMRQAGQLKNAALLKRLLGETTQRP